MNSLLKSMKEINNRKIGENGDPSYCSTLNGLMDLFAFGGAYRSRTPEDKVFLFKKAFEEDETLAIKCLFYLRDVRGGQGERQFFRDVIRWLGYNHSEVVLRNLENIPFYGRWDDLYCLVGTPIELKVFEFMRHQLALDVQSKTPSLMTKWLKSENTSSVRSRQLGEITRKYFKMTPKQYRKTLSVLRERINVLERLMSQQRWDEIEFDKIPSRAGLIYRNAFARNDFLKMRYEKFMSDSTTKVNAGTLYPCDVVSQATKVRGDFDDPQRLAVNKYWDNLTDYFNNAVFNGVAVVDTSGSMTGGQAINPIDVAIALGMYCAEKCGEDSPWHGHYISFSSHPQLISIDGTDFVDKVNRIYRTNLCENTDIEAVFDLILGVAITNHTPQKDMPENIIIISDMEFDSARGYYWFAKEEAPKIETVMEKCMRKYQKAGYDLPHLVFWNVNARNDTIPMKDNGNITFVSGYSPVLFESILTGKTGLDLVLDKLNSKRYERVK